MSATENHAKVKALLDEIGDDLTEFGGDVEGHLRVCIAHLREIVRNRRVATPEAPPAESGDGIPEDEDVDEEPDDDKTGAAPDEAPKPVRRGRARKPGDA